MKRIALAIVLAATSAHAQPTMSAEARAHFDRGRAFYDAGSYDDAIAELTAGHDIDAHADFLYALGQAYRKLGDCAHALASYRAFLATQPPEAEAAKVRANIARCPSPAVKPPRVPRVVESRPFYADTTGDALAAGGLVGLGAGITYLAFGERDARAANDAPTVARLQALSARAGRERTIGAISAIAGGGLTAGAIVHYVLASHREVSIVVTPGSASAVWGGRF